LFVAARRLPRTAVALDTELNDRRVRGGSRREVLLVGELGVGLRAELVARGAVLTEVDKLYGAFNLLAERPFDVVVVDPYTEDCGMDFVNAIKEGEVEHQLTIATLYGARGPATFLRDTRPPSQEVLEAARARHQTTPFIVLPKGNESMYRIIVAQPHATVMKNPVTVPLVATIMTVDAAQMLGRAKPMA
jgi:hypothetical protein